MKSGFAKALPRVLAHEGGYVNDPRDPGGATNKGITFRVYDAYRSRKKLPTRSVKDITAAEVSEIYRLQYWDAVKGDDLPAGIDYVLFDGAVNSGPSQSIKWLQRALGNVVVDGVMGQATLAAVNEHLHLPALVDAICDRRMAFLRSLRTFSTFGKGWTSRVSGVRTTGKAWAVNQPAGPVEKETTRKAPITDAKPMPQRAGADVATTSGVASGGAAGALVQAKEAIEPYASLSKHIATLVTILVIAGLLLTVGGIAWRWYANREARKLADALDLPQGVAA